MPSRGKQRGSGLKGTALSFVWMMLLWVASLAALVASGWFYWHEDVLRAIFWLLAALFLDYSASSAAGSNYRRQQSRESKESIGITRHGG
jgi:hypothetical protein